MTRNLLSRSLRVFSVLLIMAAVAALVPSVFLLDLNHYTRRALQRFEDASGYRLTFSDISLHLARGAGLRVDDFVLMHTGTGREFLRGDHLYIHVRLSPLLRKKITIRQLLIEKPRIRVYRDTDGIWHSFLASLAEQDSGDAGSLFGEYRLEVKTIALEGGVLEIEDELHGAGVRLDDCTIRLHRTEAGMVHMELTAQHHADSSRGTIRFTSDFQRALLRGRVPDPGLQTLLTAELVFNNLPVRECLAYLPERFSVPLDGGLLDAALAFELRQGGALSAGGESVLKGARLIAPGLGPVSLPDAALSFKAHADGRAINVSEFSVRLEPEVHLAGSARIETPDTEPKLAVRIGSGSLDALSLAQRLVAADTGTRFVWLAQACERVARAHVAIHDLSMAALLGPAFGSDAVSLQVQLGLDVSGAAAGMLYELSTPDESSITLDFASRRLRSRGRLTTTSGDSHAFDLDATVPHGKTRLKCTLDSRLSRVSLNAMVNDLATGMAAAPELYEGSVSLRTAVRFDTSLRIASDIDATGAAYGLAGIIGKHRGVANTIRLEYDSALKKRQQLPFEFRLGDGLSVNGRLLFAEKTAVAGQFIAKDFDLSAVEYSFLPESLSFAGSASGTGEFAFPVQDPGSRPVTGRLELDGIALMDNAGDQPLLQASAVVDVPRGAQPISVSQGCLTAGDTRGDFSGTLASAVPLVGTFTAPMEKYDIGDFVGIMLTIVRSFKQGQDEQQPQARNPDSMFARMDIRADLRSRETQYLDWHFGPGACVFSIKDKRLLWDAIDIEGGGGSLNGSVLYDLSNPDMSRLDFFIGRSDVDVLWAIPGLQKKQTITGRLNLKSRFGSSFTSGQELLANMEGTFDFVVSDGRLKKLALLSNILNALNVTRLLALRMPEFSADTMPFDTMTGRFTLKDRQLATDDFVLACPSMDFSAAGSLDLARERLDLLIGVQVFRTVARILGSVPYLGTKLTGKNKTITFAYFRAKGPFKNPRVRPVPLKMIDKAILKIFKSVGEVPRDLMYLPLGMIRRFMPGDVQEADNETAH